MDITELGIQVGTVIATPWDSDREFAVVESIFHTKTGARCRGIGHKDIPIFNFNVEKGKTEIEPPWMTFTELEALFDEPIDEGNYGFKKGVLEYRIYKVHKYDPLPTNYFCGGNVEYHLTVYQKYGKGVGHIFGMYISRSEDGKLHYAIPG